MWSSTACPLREVPEFATLLEAFEYMDTCKTQMIPRTSDRLRLVETRCAELPRTSRRGVTIQVAATGSMLILAVNFTIWLPTVPSLLGLVSKCFLDTLRGVKTDK